MPLTEQQKAALPVLEWLLGDERRTGRTLVMAIAIIRAACRNPAVPVYIIDHHCLNHSQTLDHMRNVIRALIDEAPWPANAYYFLNRDHFLVQSSYPFEWEPNTNFPANGPPGPLSVGEKMVPECALQRILKGVL